MNHLTHIEPLEDRIAPATIINPYTVTYQDLDHAAGTTTVVPGDTVVVHISKPLFTSVAAAGRILNFTDSSGNSIATNSGFSGNSTGEFLDKINLVGRTDAQDMSISVKVIPQSGVGNGTVNVGIIQAANFSTAFQVSGNIDLGNIYVQGNLGEIQAGDNYSTPAIKSLTVGSMKEYVQTDQTLLNSIVLGPILSMNVAGDFTTSLNVIGYQYGTINKLVIGGSLSADAPTGSDYGGSSHPGGDAGSGEIQFAGHIGSATIGSIVGGTVNTGSSTDDQLTGNLDGVGSDPSYITSLHVLGNITGGSGLGSGRVFAEARIGKVVVDGNVTGGSGQLSGVIAAPLGSVTIHGGLTGGSGQSSGSVLSQVFNSAAGSNTAVAVGSVTVGGDVTGGSAGSSGSPGDTGVISATTARSIIIGGSLIGGTTAGADTSGAVLVNSVDSLMIGKSIIGGSASNSGILTGQSSGVALKYGHILVDGDIQGGSGATSGAIMANSLGFSGGKLVAGSITSLHVNGSVIGSSGTDSGEVNTRGGLGTLYIGGNVTGGTADNSGVLLLAGGLSNGLIKGNLTGATVDSTTALAGSGYIEAGTIQALAINGNITAGANTHVTTNGSANTPDGQIADSGAIRSTANIVSLTVGGNVSGSVNSYATTTNKNSPMGTIVNPVFISAAQSAGLNAKSTTDVAIQNVAFDGNVNYLDVLAGYSPSGTGGSATADLGTPTDSTAQIASVLVKGNLSATNIVAGAAPGSTGMFGTNGDKAIAVTPVSTKVTSLIASIIVDGTATGDSTAGDTFGFVAQQVRSVYAANAPSLILHPGPDNDFLVPVSDGGAATNLVVNEVL
jgi:hypothetical protein